MDLKQIKQFFDDYVYPVATISGSIIGVGFFALPYVAAKVGIQMMLLYFLVLGGIVIFIHIIFGELSLKTPDFKRFPGFVGHYLGKWAKLVAFLAIIFGGLGTLLAYLIVGGEFLTSIFAPVFGQSNLFYTLIYFVSASLVVYFGIKAVSKFEFWALVALLISLVWLFVKSLPWIRFDNIFMPGFTPQISDLFLPYGAIIFALWGTGLIPEAEEMLGKNKKKLKKIVVISTLIPAFVYLFFIFLILGITGASTTQSALVGIKNFFGDGFVSLILLIGVVTTFSAFIASALNLKKVFIYDLGIKPWQAWVMTCFTPLIFFLLGFKSFIDLISLTGGILLGINGILILLMYKKIGGKNIVIYPLSIVFVLGVIYEIVYFIK